MSERTTPPEWFPATAERSENKRTKAKKAKKATEISAKKSTANQTEALNGDRRRGGGGELPATPSLTRGSICDGVLHKIGIFFFFWRREMSISIFLPEARCWCTRAHSRTFFSSWAKACTPSPRPPPACIPPSTAKMIFFRVYFFSHQTCFSFTL